MDFDFLDRSFLSAAKQAVADFRNAVEQSQPAGDELEQLCERTRPYGHCMSLANDFVIGAIDGSGEYPILQQDDVFVHFVSAARTCYRTESARQHKLSTVWGRPEIFKSFVVIRDERSSLAESYERYLDQLTELSLAQLVSESDYCQVFSAYGKRIRRTDVLWDAIALARASQIATHAYQLRSLAELGMAVCLLERRPKYLLLDTTLVYFLLGKTPYLPEILKRYLICRANRQGTAVIALSKSHNIPNGDLIGRLVRERFGSQDHWYLRLPAEALEEVPLRFLKDKEVPPKLSVSYLFKFHATSFPMRIDVDAAWWREHINHDSARETQFFRDLDYTCHDIRSYGYPYPLHAAHRSASLTKSERKAIRDILLQNAKSEGILRGAFMTEPEEVHREGI